MAQERQKNWLTFLFRDTSLVAVAIVCMSDQMNRSRGIFCSDAGKMAARNA